MSRTSTLKFTEIDDPIPGEINDIHDLGGLLAVNGLDAFQGRLTAATQKKLFGFPLFGKKEISIDCTGQGAVTYWWSVCFGTMAEQRTLPFTEVVAAIKTRTPLRVC